MEPNNREFRRFKVGHLENLKGFLEGINTPLQLVTFGGGGCGFYGSNRVPQLSPPKRVFCVFSMGTEPIKVQGNLLYVREVETADRKIIFYGVEFIKPHRPHVEPLVSTLEKLKIEGLVEES
ncbi:MAG: hypothetical protein JWQ35_2173 [Bacteriovoracaceae bacterium]|nr:hypothetical protein [Bacteriovoracaceae bacterium]